MNGSVKVHSVLNFLEEQMSAEHMKRSSGLMSMVINGFLNPSVIRMHLFQKWKKLLTKSDE
jgi:hypothetical protein